MLPRRVDSDMSDLSDISEPDMGLPGEPGEGWNTAGSFSSHATTQISQQQRQYRAAVNSAFLASETDLRQHDLQLGTGVSLCIINHSGQ